MTSIFLDSAAQAVDPAAETTGIMGAFGNYGLLIIVGLMLVAMYFLMIRPNKKKEKQAAEMRNSIEIGDEVTTIGGIVGRVVSIKEDTFVIETAGERSRMRFKRWAIQEVGKLALDAAPGETDSSAAAKAEKAAAKAKKEKAAKAGKE